MHAMSKREIYDYIIIGSGFGGSVSALRLAEKGYKVLVLEKGKRYRTEDFPRTNWNLRKKPLDSPFRPLRNLGPFTFKACIYPAWNRGGRREPQLLQPVAHPIR